MSSAQVIFLNRWLNCPEEIKRENYKMQTLIQEELAKFYYETRNYTSFQRALSKQKSHNLWRNRIRLIAKDGEIIHGQENQTEEVT